MASGINIYSFFQVSKIIILDIKKTILDIRNKSLFWISKISILDIQNNCRTILDIQNTISDIRNCFLDIKNNYFGYLKK